MLRSALIAALIAGCSPTLSPEGKVEGAFKQHGAEFAQSSTMTAKALLADPAPFAGKQVRVKGRVADVCQKMGCWMVLADEDKSMRVTMKDYGFVVDKDTSGRDCEVEGTVVAKNVDKKTAEHYASESGKPHLAPEGKEGGKTYELVATAIRIRQ